jgi:hypothetical protein
MSAAKKRKQAYPDFRGANPRQAQLRIEKAEIELLREKIQSRIMDNPQISKKAATLISMWVAGKTRKKAG